MNPSASKITAPNANTLSQASFLLAGVTWQDSLLQAYRNYMVVTQSIFLAVSVVLFGSQTSVSSLTDKLTYAVPFLAIAILGLSTLRFLSGAIKERSKSVDWWQRRLLKHENTYSSKRHFTTFRTAKEHGFKPPEVEADKLSQEDIDTLLRPDTPKARKVFGVFVPGFYFLWVILLVSAGVDFPWSNIVP